MKFRETEAYGDHRVDSGSGREDRLDERGKSQLEPEQKRKASDLELTASAT